MNRKQLRERSAIAAMHAIMTTFVDTQKLEAISRAARLQNMTASQWVADAATNYADCLINALYPQGQEQQ